MDPVLWDPHQEDLFDVFPRREVLVDRLPECDVLIISHRHLDHFDIRSLANLPKNMQVFIPDDPLIGEYLQKLGYKKVKPLSDFCEVKLGKTRLLTTRSENRVPEFGIVFADEEAVIWNQVDTVVEPRTVERVRSRFTDIDLLIASWQPMLEDSFQMNRSISFPYERYGQILYNIGMAAPRALVPGANAFCYRGAASWLNRMVFPMSRERFLHDVKIASPNVGGNAYPFDPGDVITVSQGSCERGGDRCPFVKPLGGDQEALSFSPVTLDGRLIDENPDHVGEEEMECAITMMLEAELSELLEAKRALLKEHIAWGIIYQLEVTLPGKKLNWFVDFNQSRLYFKQGRHPLANVFACMTGSGLYGLITRSKGWDYSILGGYFRSFRAAYEVTPRGILCPSKSDIPDPLQILFPYREILVSILDREVEKWWQRVVTCGA